MATRRQGDARALQRRNFNHLTSLVALTVSALMPSYAQAQGEEDRPRRSEESGHHGNEAVELPAITVTGQSDRTTTEGTGSYTTGSSSAATGLSLSPRETPQSISVITRQRMDDQQMTSIRDVLDNTTGVATTTTYGDVNRFYSRGFPISSNFWYDGVPSSGSAYGLGQSYMDTAVYDRVEVVRGAAGLLRGTGDPSASVNLVRKRPLREFNIGGSISAGSHDDYRGVFDLSTPVTEDGRIRARLVGAYHDRKSFQDYYHQKRKTVYGVVEADLTSSTTLTIGHEWQDNMPKGFGWGGVPVFYSDGTRTDWSRSVSTATKWNYMAMESNTTFVGIQHHFDNGWEVKANYTYMKSELTGHLFSVNGFPDRNTGLGLTPAANDGGSLNKDDTFDVQATGPFQLFGREHEVVVGGNHARSRSWSGYNIMAGQKNGPFTPIGSIFEWDGNYPNWAREAPKLAFEDEINQKGAYGALRLSITDPLKVIVGARYSSYEMKPATGQGFKKEKFTPYVGAIYDLNNTHSLYASYTEVFNPQTQRDVNNRVLEPTEGTNAEVGVKGEYFGGRLNASLALFETKLDGVGEPDGERKRPDGSPAYRSVDGTKSRGFEIDLQGQLTPGWNVSAGFSHFTASTQTGARLNSQIPRTTARLFTTYRLPGDLSRLTIGGGVNWQSRYFETLANPVHGQVQVEQGSYALTSLMARYEISEDLQLGVNVNNLFDRKYYRSMGMFGYTYGEPRTVMVNLTYRMR